MNTEIDYLIRECFDSDIEKIVCIEDKWTPGIHAIFSEYIPNSNDVERCYVAERDGSIIGFVYGFVLPRGMLIPHFLYVVEDYRGLDVARSLLSTFEMKSGCSTSQIYYERGLSDYYTEQGYQSSDNLEVALKELYQSANKGNWF